MEKIDFKIVCGPYNPCIIVIVLFKLIKTMFMKIGNIFPKYKNILYFFGLTGGASFYFYNKHEYEKELYERMLYIIENNVPLSGVYLQQRQPFGFLGYIQWLVPYHQSLKIVNKNTNTTRHVGLGGISGLHSEFVLHDKQKYDYLNRFETSIPIECWVDYKRKVGHFPENINIDQINRLTMTSEENENNKTEVPVYKTTFGSIIQDIDGTYTLSTCKSAVLWAVHQEDLDRHLDRHL